MADAAADAADAAADAADADAADATDADGACLVLLLQYVAADCQYPSTG